MIDPKVVIKYADRLYLTAKAYADIEKFQTIHGEESNAWEKLQHQLSDWESMRRNHWSEIEWEKDPFLP